jgi:hypothetical protein
LLDDEFLEAYKHGIIIACCDGIIRRFFPRILTYSADYPEKYSDLSRCLFTHFLIFSPRIILASIRNMGRCACPRCLIPMSRFQNVGKTRDMQQRVSLQRVDDEVKRSTVATAREIIYQKKYAVDNENVETLLKPQSLVPTAVSGS